MAPDAPYIPKPLKDASFRKSEQVKVKAHFCINGYPLKRNATQSMICSAFPEELV